MARLLIVHHSPTPSTQRLVGSIVSGARDDTIGVEVEVVVREALETSLDDVESADGFLLGTSANFGYMSGALKHVFDQFFLQLGGSLGADGSATAASSGRKPYGLWVHGRYDTTGAVRSVQSIVGALPWTQSAPVLEVVGDVEQSHLEAAYELGATVAALLL